MRWGDEKVGFLIPGRMEDIPTVRKTFKVSNQDMHQLAHDANENHKLYCMSRGHTDCFLYCLNCSLEQKLKIFKKILFESIESKNEFLRKVNIKTRKYSTTIVDKKV